MAINRFWNQAPTAEYSPMSMQELAYAPQIMYQRDQDLTAKVDAMNDAATTLQSSIGDSAPKMDEFNTNYQAIKDAIAKEGATPQNLEKALQLRKTFVNQIQPMQQFAEQRQQLRQLELQKQVDPDNIQIGPSALQSSYSDFLKNRTIAPPQFISRNKLMSLGMEQGDQYSESNKRLTKIDPDTFMATYQGGMTSPAEANAHDKPGDPYSSWLDDASKNIASSLGVPVTPDILNAARTAIKMKSVGKPQMEHMSAQAIQNYLLKNGTGEPAFQGLNILNSEDQSIPLNADISSNFKVNRDIMLKDPVIQKAYNDAISSLSPKDSHGRPKFNNVDDLEAERQRLFSLQKTLPNPSSVGGINWNANGPSQQSSHTPYEQMVGKPLAALDEIQSTIDKNFYNTAGWDKATLLRLNPIAVEALPEKDRGEIKRKGDAYSQYVRDHLNSFTSDDPNATGGYGPMTPDSKQALKGFASAPAEKKSIRFIGFRFNGKPQIDQRTGQTGYMGSGQSAAVFSLDYTDKDGKNPVSEHQIVMNLPPQMMQDGIGTIQEVVNHYGTKENNGLLANHLNANNKYNYNSNLYNQEQIAKQQSQGK